MIVVDTREKEISHILEYFSKQKIAYTHEKLAFGDFTLKIEAPSVLRDFYMQDICTVERKANLEELSGNLCHEKERMDREFLRSRGSVHLLIEKANYSYLVNGKYKTQYSKEAFTAQLKAFEARYGLHVTFLKDNAYSGQFIWQTLVYSLREALIRGIF